MTTRPIGGEFPWPAASSGYRVLTDSGRSSLRLLLRSGLAQRRFLLPDYLCDVIPTVFEQEGVSFGWYRVNADLSIDASSLRGQAFDALYVIDYFGQPAAFESLAGPDTWIVQDSVFSPLVQPPTRAHWAGFNSLRKITALPDGSVLRSTLPLQDDLSEAAEAGFVPAKRRAKEAKRRYLDGAGSSEADYLAGFAEGEALIDAQTGVHAMSADSVHRLMDLYAGIDAERRARLRNVAFLDARLSRLRLPVETDFPSLYVLRVEGRDALREFLRERRIFLPVHWPNARRHDNPLYAEVISIPVDSRYDERDMARVADAIGEFHGR